MEMPKENKIDYISRSQIENDPTTFFTGEVKNGIPIRGKLEYMNEKKENLIYLGEFKDGKKDGKGKIHLPNGYKFDGEFKNNQEVKGTLFHPNGDVFVGPLRKKGRGRVFYANGDRYIGDIFNCEPHGSGVYYSKKDNEVYKVKFENGVIKDFDDIY